MASFCMEGWAIEEEPKSNPSPSVESMPKFRKPKLKSNPLAISIGSFELDVRKDSWCHQGLEEVEVLLCLSLLRHMIHVNR